MKIFRSYLWGTVTASALLFAPVAYADPGKSKLCDLAELVKAPERITESSECDSFYVRVKDQPVTCGLFDQLISEMQREWTSTATELCAQSESCRQIMAECAAKQLSGKDLQAQSSSSLSSSSASSTSSTSSQSSTSPLPVTAGKSSSNSSARGGSVGSASSAPSTITILTGSSGKPVATSTRGQRGASQVPTVQATAASTASSTATNLPLSGVLSSDCYVCIYDETDKATEAECKARAKKAKARGVKDPVVVSNYELLFDYRDKLCACRNIEVLAIVHGTPGDEWRPFQEAREIIEVAPQCSSISFDNFRCSGFDSANEALASAKELSRQMAESGYAGTVTLKGRQTVHEAGDAVAAAKYQITKKLTEGRNPITKFIISQYVKMAAISRPGAKEYCDLVNTPLSFQVCASGVKIALDPCKKPGDVSEVHKGAEATQTIVCEKNGKRANQSCSYVKLADVPDVTLAEGTLLSDVLKTQGYGTDGCDARGVCLCKWMEPEVCSK